MIQDMVHFGECSMCTWKERLFCCFGVDCSINVTYIQLVDFLFSFGLVCLVLLPSWIYRFVSFAKYGMFSAIFSSNVCLAHYSFSCSIGTLLICILKLGCPIGSWSFVHVFPVLFRLENFCRAIFKFTDFLSVVSSPFCNWFHPVRF